MLHGQPSNSILNFKSGKLILGYKKKITIKLFILHTTKREPFVYVVATGYAKASYLSSMPFK